MAQRKPVVIGGDGLPQQLQASDTIAGPHAKFTATTTLSFSINIGATQVIVLTVTPVVAGDVLAAGEDISMMPTADLPGGLNPAYCYVSAQNTVRLGFTASSLLTLSQTVTFRFTAHR